MKHEKELLFVTDGRNADALSKTSNTQDKILRGRP